jgi:hypothetical protein
MWTGAQVHERAAGGPPHPRRSIVALGVAAGVFAIVPPAAGAPPLPYGPDTCKPGFVWREAFPDDHVCVQHGPGLPDIRKQTADENAAAPGLRAGGGVYGPDTCKQGYVWRETRPADHVCVTPRSRDRARVNNGNAVQNLLYPPASSSHGIGVRVHTFRGGRPYVSGVPTFTPNRDVVFYLWSEERRPSPGAFIVNPWTITADAYGQLPLLSIQNGTGTYIWGPGCWDSTRTAYVIVLDTGTGTISNAGSIFPPCGVF